MINVGLTAGPLPNVLPTSSSDFGGNLPLDRLSYLYGNGRYNYNSASSMRASFIASILVAVLSFYAFA